jgi:signal transduction histidine kinase
VTRFFEAHPSLTDPEDRRRSQSLGMCLAVLGSLFGCVDISLSLMVESYQTPWFGYVVMIATFALNRAGYYRFAAPMLVLMFPSVVFTVIYLGNGLPYVSFGYLVIAPMLAANFLPMWGVAALTLVDLCGIAAAPLYSPEVVTLAPQLIGPLSANAIVGLLALLYMHQRNGLERDRRRALEDGEERLRLSLDAAQMGTWQLDYASCQLSLDARARGMLGSVTEPAALLGAFEPEDEAALRNALSAMAAGTLSGFAVSAQPTVARAPRFVEITGRAVSDASGGVGRVIGTIVDVSRRRNLEEQLHRSQKMEALGRMSGGIAHDFNNVLTVILASAALLRRRAPAPELDQIDSAALSAAALTGKLLAFSRGAVLAPRVLDLTAVVNDALAMITRLIGEDIIIRHRFASGLWLTRSDSNQLEQVLLNLAANARDAMPNGGSFGIELDNVALTSQELSHHPDAAPGSYVRVRVSDTGKGMDEETQRHIFEPFFTTKERGKGTGLGLAMVFGTVSQSGGFIETQSTPGKGARFDLYFPRCHGVTSTAEDLPPQLSRGHETLLLVEDDTSVRKVIGRILEEAGYTVLFANSAAEARSLFAADHRRVISLLLTDEVMPGGRGSDLVAELRRSRSDLPALRMTGYVEPRSATVSGPLELPTLQKPFEAELLLRRVRELLDGGSRLTIRDAAHLEHGTG